MNDLGPHLIDMHREKLSDLLRRSREALEQLSDEDVNWRPNAESNSIANLIIHMAGNLHQRLSSGIGGAPDRRDRDAEFSASQYHPRQHLPGVLEEAFRQAETILCGLTPDQLAHPQRIRNRQVTVLDVLFTVATHMSEHVGQILYIAKLRLGSAYRILSIPRRTDQTHVEREIPVRKALVSDLPAMVDLSERKRTQYESYQPLFWRKAGDSRERQLAFFEHLLARENIIALVHDGSGVVDGFVIATLAPSPPVYAAGLSCVIDDYCVSDHDWSGVGAALLDAVTRAAEERGAVQTVVVCGHMDQPKREMLRVSGHTIASEWWVKPIDAGR